MRRARSLSVAGLLAALVLGPLAVAAPQAAASDESGRAGLSPVRATLNYSRDSGQASGRVISKDASCKKKVAVHLFARLGDDVEYVGPFRTDRQGRWSTSGSSRRLQTTVELFAVVPGEKGCRVAQSPTETLTMRAGRADRSVTIDFRQNGLEGRVTSPKAACEKQATIAFFFRDTAKQPWQLGDITTTNDQGRYRYEFLQPRHSAWRSAKAKEPTIAVVLGDEQCAVAQSPTIGLPPL